MELIGIELSWGALHPLNMPV